MNLSRPPNTAAVSWRTDISVYRFPEGSPRPRAVYVHVPFCALRCGYCDFTLLAGRDDMAERFLTAIERELSVADDPCPVDSLFLGGGTPTHLTPRQLDRLVRAIQRSFPLRPGAEFTVEANPDGLTGKTLSVLAGHGMNRLSLGVQSFDAAVLRILERTHTPDVACESIERARQYVANISVDLIFGVPGLTHSSWEQTLQIARTLPVRHVSTYGLTWEQGTAFDRRRRRGELSPMNSEDERAQYAAAMDILPAAGLEQYEISNFARAGSRCQHNEVYWNADEYFGFGPGAARYLAGVRSTNSRNVVRWIESWEQGIPLLQQREQLNEEERAREAVMLGLRQNEGVELPAFKRRFGWSLDQLAGVALERHVAGGLLELDSSGSILRLTRDGRFMADTVIADFL